MSQQKEVLFQNVIGVGGSTTIVVGYPGIAFRKNFILSISSCIEERGNYNRSEFQERKNCFSLTVKYPTQKENPMGEKFHSFKPFASTALNCSSIEQKQPKSFKNLVKYTEN